ncbi:hypothetical protein HYPDE_32523 [Hyphomicrobium denitrificans 1NES1]|uniref:Uncharacterized protein n=1 Tax=Hyphomicrobium denitrificans 1NES1 TaxID=670307 RepID=N0B7D6_9HYPH|nr:hypothetical protein HYPDE_32523 [Hyphomicrobium denitrificans 1NES1]
MRFDPDDSRGIRGIRTDNPPERRKKAIAMSDAVHPAKGSASPLPLAGKGRGWGVDPEARGLQTTLRHAIVTRRKIPSGSSPHP